MRLKSVVFYQAVKLWDGKLLQTINDGKNNTIDNVTITLQDHMITLQCPTQAEVIIVGTSNMREARYWREPSSEPKAITEHNGDIDSNAQPGGDHGASSDSPAEGSLPEKTEAPSGFDPRKYAGKQPEPKLARPAKAKAQKEK